jgi:hypothetical protein
MTLAAHAKWLRKAAAEIRAENHAGWGNTCEQAADAIDTHIARHAELIAKLRELVDESKAVDVPNVLVKQLGLLGRFMRLAEGALLDAQPAAMTGRVP